MSETPIKVLVIEDDPDFTFQLKERLKASKDFSLQVESSESVSEGLVRLRAGGIDLILLDLNLRDSKGFNTLDWITSRTKGIPIIVLTGEYDESIGLETLKRGAQDYLLKGQIDAHTLTRSIRYALERKRQEEVVREAYMRISGILSSIPSILIQIDHDNTIRYWNQDAEKILGVPVKEAIDKPLSDCGVNWDFGVLKKGLLECRAMKRVLRLEDINFKTKEGQARILGATLSPIQEPSGTSILIYGCDITERKRLEAELPQKR